MQKSLTLISHRQDRSQSRSTEAAGNVKQEPLAERQKIAFSAADKEQQIQVELEQLRSQKGKQSFSCKLTQTSKQELGQQQENLRRRQKVCRSAQRVALLSQNKSCQLQHPDVQLGNTPFTPDLQNQVVLFPSSPAKEHSACSTAKQGEKGTQEPRLFQIPNN